MKIVIRTGLFHLLCILIFASIYFYISEHFQSDNGNNGNNDNNGNNSNNNKFTDFLLLSTTVQAGVGMTELTPTTFYSKLILILQQMLLIFTHIITLYIFTL
jgi:hypothetical protein